MSDLFPPGLEPPSPPPELRAQVLSAASRAFDAAPEHDAWTRALSSPVLRLAWAASVAVLGAAHLFVSVRRAAPRPDPVPPEIRQMARLPRIDVRSLPDEAAPTPIRAEERS